MQQFHLFTGLHTWNVRDTSSHNRLSQNWVRTPTRSKHSYKMKIHNTDICPSQIRVLDKSWVKTFTTMGKILVKTPMRPSPICRVGAWTLIYLSLMGVLTLFCLGLMDGRDKAKWKFHRSSQITETSPSLSTHNTENKNQIWVKNTHKSTGWRRWVKTSTTWRSVSKYSGEQVKSRSTNQSQD